MMTKGTRATMMENMKHFDWNSEKNLQLEEERGVTFEDVVFFIQAGGLLDDVQHPNPDVYPHQRILIVNIDGYAYLVPYVEEDQLIFLKTIIPSRKATRPLSR